MAEDNPIEGLDTTQSAFQPVVDTMNQDILEDLSRTTTTTTMYISGDTSQFNKPEEPEQLEDPYGIREAVNIFRVRQSDAGESPSVGDIKKLFPESSAQERLQIESAYPDLFKEDASYNKVLDTEYQKGIEKGMSSSQILDDLVKKQTGTKIGLIARRPDLFNEQTIKEEETKLRLDTKEFQEKENKIKSLKDERENASFNRKRGIDIELAKLEGDIEILSKMAKDTDYKKDKALFDLGRKISVDTQDLSEADLESISKKLDPNYVVPILNNPQEKSVFEMTNTLVGSTGGLEIADDDFIEVYKKGNYDPEKHSQYDEKLSQVINGFVSEELPVDIHQSFYDRNNISKNDLVLRNKMIIRNVPDFNQGKIYSIEEMEELEKRAEENLINNYGDIEFDELKIILGDDITPKDVYNRSLRSSMYTNSKLNDAIVVDDEEATLENLQTLFPESTSLFRFDTRTDGKNSIIIRTFVAGEELNSTEINLDEENEPLRKIRDFMSGAMPPANVQRKIMEVADGQGEFIKEDGSIDKVKLSLYTTKYPEIFGDVDAYTADDLLTTWEKSPFMIDKADIRRNIRYQESLVNNYTAEGRKDVDLEQLQLLDTQAALADQIHQEKLIQKGGGLAGLSVYSYLEPVARIVEFFDDQATNVQGLFGYVDSLSDEEYKSLRAKGLSDEDIIRTEKAYIKEKTEASLNRIVSGFSGETQQSIAEQGFLAEAFATAIQSLTTMAVGLGAKIPTITAFGIRSQVSLENELKDTDLSDTEKFAITLPMAVLEGVLEEWGLQKIFKPGVTASKKLILSKALPKIKKGATPAQIKKSIQRAIEELSGGTIEKIGRAGIYEGMTEFGQTASEINLKTLANSISEKDLFKDVPNMFTPEGFIDGVNQIGKATAMGFVVGSGINTASQAKSLANGFKKSDNDVSMDEAFDMITSNDRREIFFDRLDLRVLAGEITDVDARTIKENIDKAYPLMMQIPATFSSNQKEEAYNLLLEKQELEQEVKDKNKNLVVEQTERINEIDRQLELISKGELKDAVQESETKEEVLPDEQPEMGLQDVGQGDTQEQEATEVQQKELVDDDVVTEEYVKELEDIKQSDPEQYWSVDSVSLEDAKEGTVISVEGGKGIVGPDGDIKGVFKSKDSKAEKVADKILEEAVKNGGTKLDNFDNYLTRIYKRNGFRVASRTPFNEEFAPDGWNKEKHGTPDVVAMVYDPESKLDIEEKTFDNPETGYDEMIAYRDSFIEAPAAEQVTEDVVEDITPEFAENIKNIEKQAENARRAISKVLPGVEIITHSTEESYRKATGETDSKKQATRGEYNPNTKTIHINQSKANNRTVGHEVFHAVLLEKVKTDNAAKDLTDRMIKSVSKNLEGMPEVKEALDEFAANYDQNIQNEEKLAELVGILAGNYAQMNKPSQSLIKRFLDRLAKMFGLKPFTDGEVVDVLNAIAGKVALGEEISDVDLKVIPSPTDSKGNLKTPSKKSQNNLKKRKQNIIDGVKDQVVSGEIVSTSLPNKDDVHSSKEYVVGISSLEKIANTDKRAKDQYIKIAKEAASYGISKTKDVNNFEDAKKVISEFKQVVKSNLKWLHDSVDKDVRDISKLWYDGANKISNDLANEYGYTTEQVSGVMAVLSPQMDWFRNLSLGERVIDIYKNNQDSLFDDKMIEFVETKTTGTGKNKKPLFKNKEEIISRVKNKKLSELNAKDQSYFIRVYDEVYNSRNYNNITPNGEINGLVRTKSGNPGKVGWGDFSTIEKAISILNDGSVKNISTNLGNQHKVRNFFNNISNPNDKNAVTIDTHAVAAALLKPLSGKSKQVTYNFGGASAVSTGMTGTYPVYADAYRELANELGILPREVQSITWEAGRGLFKAVFKSNKSNEEKINNVWNQYESGSISLKQAQSKIDKLAGGISTPVWYEYLADENVESLDKNSAALDQAALDEEVSIDDQVTTPSKRKQKDEGPVEPRIDIRNLKKKSDKKIKEINKGKGPILRRLRRSLFDRQNDIKRVIKDFVPNPKKVSKIINRIVTKAGASGYANELFKQQDKKIFGGLEADQIENLELIIYARRIVAINENRRERGMNPYKGMDGLNEQDALQNLEKFEKDLGKKEFDDLSKRADEYFEAFKNNLKMLRDSGRITEETYENLKDVEYSPIKTLKYIIPQDTMTDEDINNAVSTLGVNKKDIMKLSDMNENEILFDARFLLMMNTNIVVRRSFENKMLNEFAQGYESIDKEGKKALSDFIIEGPVKKVPPGFRKVEYFQDGVKNEMVMREDYARQLLDIKNQNNFLKGFGTISGSNILRFFATGGNPLFIIGNTAVDFANIAFFSDVYSSIKPLATVQLAYDFVKNFLRKTGSTNNYNKIKMEFMEHGGAMDYLSTDGLRMVQEMRLKNRILNKFQKGLAAYARFMSYLGETGEMSFRLAVYERVKNAEIKKFEKKNDRSPNQQEMDDIMFEAAAQSRETIDFSQGGTWVKQMDQALPYFNAAMQGLRRPLDFARKNPVGFTSNVIQYAVMAAGMTATSLGTLLRSIGDDEEEKKKLQDILDSISEYEKANYHIIFTGNKDKDGNYQYVRIKKLPLISILGTATEQYTTKYLLKSQGIDYEIDESSIKKAIELSAPLDIVGPITGDESVGQAIGGIVKRNPLAAAWLTYTYNEDTFTGEKVFYEPRDKKIKPYAEGLYDERVNDIYKIVAPALDMSPKRAQAAVEKLITSESTNPSISIFYALTNGLFDTEADAFKENADTFNNGMGHFLDVVSKKMVRHTNPNLLRYKDKDKTDELEERIDTDKYLQDIKIKKEIDKNINTKILLEGKSRTDKYKTEYKKVDDLLDRYKLTTNEKKKYQSYAKTKDLKGKEVFKELRDIIYEKSPEMIAARLYKRYGNNLDEDERKELSKAFKISKVNDIIYKKGYQLFYKKYYLNKSQKEIDKFEESFGKIR